MLLKRFGALLALLVVLGLCCPAAFAQSPGTMTSTPSVTQSAPSAPSTTIAPTTNETTVLPGSTSTTTIVPESTSTTTVQQTTAPPPESHTVVGMDASTAVILGVVLLIVLIVAFGAMAGRDSSTTIVDRTAI